MNSTAIYSVGLLFECKSIKQKKEFIKFYKNFSGQTCLLLIENKKIKDIIK